MVWKSGKCPVKCAYYVCCGVKVIRKNIIKKQSERYDKIEGTGDVDLYMPQVIARLEKAEFLSGDSIGILDLSCWGVVYIFAYEPCMPFFQAIFD